MTTVTPFPKRVYLSKDNVYIELLETVPPNVLNGVRFLYNQFVKKPGVIINDPPGCEPETQVVMFLRGIHKGLDQHLKPVLILCHSSKLTIWMDCLLNWIPNYDELVAIDLAKPTTKKSIYVITTDRLESYCRRDWGIAVIDDDAFLQYKMPPATFTALFKIYITTDDLREHLPKLAQIHKWLYPDMNLDINQFRPKSLNVRDILEKRFWFSAFAEDLIVRCDKEGPVRYPEPVCGRPHWMYHILADCKADLVLDFSEDLIVRCDKQDPVRYPEPLEPTPAPRITKKNKDATGTKIKRTKRKIDDDNTESANKKIVANNNLENTSSRATCVAKVSSDSEENMDIESFIRDREPIRMDELKYIPDIDSIPLASDKSDDLEEKSEGVEENSDDLRLNYSEDLVDTDDAAYALETQDDGVENNELEFKEKEVDSCITNDNVVTNIVDGKAQTDSLFEDTPVEDTRNCDTKEFVEEIVEINNLADSCKLESENLNLKENNDIQIDIDSKTKLESKDEIQPIKENGVKKESTKSDDIDSKWEEMALKKFKGSLLDRIF